MVKCEHCGKVVTKLYPKYYIVQKGFQYAKLMRVCYECLHEKAEEIMRSGE